MGRIKTQLIKRSTMKIFEENRDKFTTDYEKNKIVVDDLLDISSKKLRNSIAGYVTRLVKTSKD